MVEGVQQGPVLAGTFFLALRVHCVRAAVTEAGLTHPRTPVTCVVARRSSKAYKRTMKMPSKFKGLQRCETSTCGTTYLHMHRLINV